MPAADSSVGTTSTCEVGVDSTTRAVVGRAADTGDHERHAGRLLVEVEPLLVQPAVGAEQLAVIGGEHEHRVVRRAVGHCAAHGIDGTVDLGMQPVVQPPVLGARIS